ncbi:sulfite oxidase [Fusarium circinatum]|uniref:Sulfite oxidase n=1 Tax=Fusarium circinatum TaxID=48490 RepID=A0A8H5U5V1_FUSCI|nr:sulfite oxidase [Fusarium circinatum]
MHGRTPATRTSGPDIPEDPDLDVQDERPGWRGYVGWEDYPEKKAKAHQRFSRVTFRPPPDFHLEPLPATNPVLESKRWRLWHKAIKVALDQVPQVSWETVLKEKHPEILHLLEFPCNEEVPKSLTTKDYIMPNELHFVRNLGGIPDIDTSAYGILLDRLVNDPKTLILADFQNESLFPRVGKLVAIQCSGTRRFKKTVEYSGEGDEMINAPWAEGARGTAKWTSVSLQKDTKYCGGLMDGAKYLELSGANTYFKGGQCMNYVMEYLYFQQQTGKHNQLSTMGVQIQEMPVTSAIMSPWNKEVVVQDGEIEVKAPSISSLSQEDAVRLAGDEPDYHVKDMYSFIERGHYPTLIMYTQVMDPKEDYPATPVGKLVLNKNPDNHFDFIEKVAFSPWALISGIAPSADIALVYTTSSFYAIDLWTPTRHVRRVDQCVLTGTKVQILFIVKSGPADVVHSEWVGIVQAYPSDVEEEDWE